MSSKVSSIYKHTNLGSLGSLGILGSFYSHYEKRPQVDLANIAITRDTPTWRHLTTNRMKNGSEPAEGRASGNEE